MLGWIPVMIVAAFLLGCMVFTVASCLQIFKVIIKRNANKVKPSYVKKSVPV